MNDAVERGAASLLCRPAVETEEVGSLDDVRRLRVVLDAGVGVRAPGKPGLAVDGERRDGSTRA